MNKHQRPQAFETTQWSVVLAAAESESETAQMAMDSLCQRYWYPLYSYLRRRVPNAQDAQDLTQDFFARLMEKDLVARADPARGRFRSFLLSSLKNFLNNHWDQQRALKRGGDRRFLSLDLEQGERRFRLEPVEDRTPESIFERQWALDMMDQALQQLQQHYSQRGRIELFNGLKCFLSGEEAQNSHREIADQLGMTPGAVKTAVHRLRRQYGDLLRDEVAATLANRDDIEDELRCLLSSLSK